MVYAKIKLKLKTAPAPFNLITVNAPERLIFPVQKILFKCYKTVQINKPFKIGNAYQKYLLHLKNACLKTEFFRQKMSAGNQKVSGAISVMVPLRDLY